MDEGRVKGPACGIENCRSRVYEEGEDGYLYCQNGHRKGELLAGEDDDMFETAARTRTRKKTDKDEHEKTSKYFKGPKAIDLQLKCLQLVLRHQLWFLIREKGLPAELEAIVQDLWALRILQLESKIISEGKEFASSQDFSASETETETERRTSSERSRQKKLKNLPNLLDCLALCYLGMLTLRLPITPGDIYTWTIDGKMPYRRAIKLIPPDMQDRLPATYHAALDPNSLLSLARFYSTVVDITTSIQREYGVTWPPLNVPLLLFRYLKELAVPLEIYDATIRIGNLLGYDFALGTTIGIRHLPEANLIACLVICVKIFYPFDGERRHPMLGSEPAAATMNWKRWRRAIDNAKSESWGENSHYTTEELFKLKEKDVFSMTRSQLDQYLDFYMTSFLDETHIAPSSINSDFRNALYEMFPIAKDAPQQTNYELPRLGNEEKLRIMRAVHSQVEPISVIAEKEESGVRRPGEDYASWKGGSNVPEHAKRFYEEAARSAGLTVDMLLKAVSHAESRIEDWKKEQRGRDKSRH